MFQFFSFFLAFRQGKIAVLLWKLVNSITFMLMFFISGIVALNPLIFAQCLSVSEMCSLEPQICWNSAIDKSLSEANANFSPVWSTHLSIHVHSVFHVSYGFSAVLLMGLVIALTLVEIRLVWTHIFHNSYNAYILSND